MRLFGSLLAVALASAAIVVSAQALPGDPPIVSLTPADGATVVAEGGKAGVTFRCPGYRKFAGSDPSDTVVGDAGDYEATFSKSNQVDASGNLIGGFVSPSVSVAGDGVTCSSSLDLSEDSGSPEVVGTRVFWQAERDCTGCPGQRSEHGPVRSFLIKPAPVKGKLEVPRRLYAGYLSVFTISTKAESADRALLQRRVGKRWRTVAADGAGEKTRLIAKLPAGRQTLRAVIVIGKFKTTVAKRRVTVRRGGQRVTSRRDDGKYEARKTPRKVLLGFRVARGGKVLRNFKSSLLVFCFGPTIESNRFVVAFANLRSVRVAPDGSVVGRLRLKSKAEITLIGRLRNRRFRGTVTMSFSTCNGQKKLDAVRAR